jgi:hypothetical protein
MDKIKKSWKQVAAVKPVITYDTEVKQSRFSQLVKHAGKLWKTLKSSIGVFIIMIPFTIVTYTFVKAMEYYSLQVRPSL